MIDRVAEVVKDVEAPRCLLYGSVQVAEHLLAALKVLCGEEDNADRLFANRLILAYRVEEGGQTMLSIVNQEVGRHRKPELTDVRVVLVDWLELSSCVEGDGQAREDPVILVVEDIARDVGNALCVERALSSLLAQASQSVGDMIFERTEMGKSATKYGRVPMLPGWPET